MDKVQFWAYCRQNCNSLFKLHKIRLWMLSICNTSTLRNYMRKSTQASICLLINNNKMNNRNCQQTRLIWNTRKSYIRTWRTRSWRCYSFIYCFLLWTSLTGCTTRRHELVLLTALQESRMRTSWTQNPNDHVKMAMSWLL